MKLLAVPSINLPKKSHEKQVAPERKHIEIVKDRPIITTIANSNCYKSFSDFQNRVSKLKLAEIWQIFHTQGTTSLQKFREPYAIPFYEVIVDDNLMYNCIVLGWVLPTSHVIVQKYRQSANNVFISDLLTEIENFRVLWVIKH